MPLNFSPKYELGQVLYYEAISQDEMATAVISRFVCIGITVLDTPNAIPPDITSATEPYYDTEHNFDPYYVYSGFD